MLLILLMTRYSGTGRNLDLADVHHVLARGVRGRLAYAADGPTCVTTRDGVETSTTRDYCVLSGKPAQIKKFDPSAMIRIFFV